MPHSRETPAQLAVYHWRAVLEPEEINRYTSSTSSEETAMQMHRWDGVGVVHRDEPEVDGCSLLLFNLRRRSS